MGVEFFLLQVIFIYLHYVQSISAAQMHVPF